MACGRSRRFEDDGVRGLVAYMDFDVRDARQVPIRYIRNTSTHKKVTKPRTCKKAPPLLSLQTTSQTRSKSCQSNPLYLGASRLTSWVREVSAEFPFHRRLCIVYDANKKMRRIERHANFFLRS